MLVWFRAVLRYSKHPKCWDVGLYTGKQCCFNVSDILNKKVYLNYIFLFSPCRYAFPGLVTVTSHLCWTQKNRLGGQSKSLAVPAVVVLLRTVAVLLARFRSRGLSRCILSGDAPSPHASSLRSPGPVCACECKRIPAAAAEMEWKHPTALMLLVCVQGDPSCRRSALLKDDSLLEFYYKDTRTYYDMFQRGLSVTGREKRPHSPRIQFVRTERMSNIF